MVVYRAEGGRLVEAGRRALPGPTVAMFLVGGGILVHGLEPLHHWVQGLEGGGGPMGSLGPVLVNGLTGLVAGGVLLAVVSLVQRLRRRSPPGSAPGGGGET